MLNSSIPSLHFLLPTPWPAGYALIKTLSSNIPSLIINIYLYKINHSSSLLVITTTPTLNTDLPLLQK